MEVNRERDRDCGGRGEGVCKKTDKHTYTYMYTCTRTCTITMNKKMTQFLTSTHFTCLLIRLLMTDIAPRSSKNEYPTQHSSKKKSKVNSVYVYAHTKAQ